MRQNVWDSVFMIMMVYSQKLLPQTFQPAVYDNQFSSAVSKLTSMRNKLNIDSWKQKLSFVRVMVHKNYQKYYLGKIKTKFSENKDYQMATFVKIKFSMPENASFQGYFTEVSFDTSEGNQLSYFQNGYLKKIFNDVTTHIIR